MTQHDTIRQTLIIRCGRAVDPDTGEDVDLPLPS